MSKVSYFWSVVTGQARLAFFNLHCCFVLVIVNILEVALGTWLTFTLLVYKLSSATASAVTEKTLGHEYSIFQLV